jgi:hypothetical protein
MFRLQVTIIRQTFQYMDMKVYLMIVTLTETCSSVLYVIEYIVVFLIERHFS